MREACHSQQHDRFPLGPYFGGQGKASWRDRKYISLIPSVQSLGSKADLFLDEHTHSICASYVPIEGLIRGNWPETIESRTTKHRRSSPLQVLSTDSRCDILDIIRNKRRWCCPNCLKLRSRESVFIDQSHQKFQNTIWSKVNWKGILAKSLKIFFVSEAFFWKPAPGNHSGMYFTEKVGEYSSQYQEHEIGLQREIKSTRYAPGSLNSKKQAIADSARVMIWSSCACGS